MNPNDADAAAQAVGALMLFMLAVPFLMLGLLIIFTIFWLWMLIDCATNDNFKGNDKIVWVLIVLFAFVLGAILYLFIGKPKKPDAVKRFMPLSQPAPTPSAAPFVQADPDSKYYENYGKK